MHKDFEKSAAVGRLMLKEFDTWDQFQKASVIPSGNRKQRRKTESEINKGIRRFVNANFVGASEKKLAQLWDAVTDSKGLRMNMPDFEKTFFKIRDEKRNAIPDHSMVDISLWGLGYEFPEKHLCDSVALSLEGLTAALAERDELNFNLQKHRSQREKIRHIPRKISHHNRSILMFSFALAECFLNGIAWKFLKSTEATHISNKTKNRLEDKQPGQFANKLNGFDGLLFDYKKLGMGEEELDLIVNAKDYRDAVTHPSPFSYQSSSKSILELEKTGRVYDLDEEVSIPTAICILKLINQYHLWKHGEKPWWTKNLEQAASNYQKEGLNRK